MRVRVRGRGRVRVRLRARVRGDERREQADEYGRRRPQGEGRRDQRDHARVQGGRVAGGGEEQQRRDRRAGGGDQPGPGVPAVRAVAGADGPATAEPQSGEGGGDPDQEHRDAVRPARGGQQPVRPRAHAEQAGEGERGGGTAYGGRDPRGTAVTAGVHRGGEGDGALQRALQDREPDLEQAPHAPVRAAPETAGGTQALDVGDEVRREGEGDDDRDTHLVQGAGEGLEEAGGVGEGVGGAYADEQGGELHRVVQGEGEALGGDPAAEADALRPVGEGDFGEGEEGVGAGDGGAEDRGEQEADEEDREGELDEGAVGAGPGGVGAAGDDHVGGDGDEEGEQKGLVVRVAAVPRASAHSHQAPGWRAPRR